jgi:hypothetical protein
LARRQRGGRRTVEFEQLHMNELSCGLPAGTMEEKSSAGQPALHPDKTLPVAHAMPCRNSSTTTCVEIHTGAISAVS